MADVPKAGPGWYPDPELVDTVRYWDGDDWTEHRAPAGQQASTPPGSAPASSPRAAKETAGSGRPKRRRRWPWVAAVVALAVAVVIGVSVKNSLDSNIREGLTTADAMTTSEEEQQAVASVFATPEATAETEPATSENRLGSCDFPADEGGAQGQWIAVTKSDFADKGDRFYLNSACQVVETDPEGLANKSGVWGQDPSGTVRMLRGCRSACDSASLSRAYTFAMSDHGNTLTRKGSKSGGRMVLQRRR